MQIKKEHLPLIEKISEFSLRSNWSDDTLINFVTLASVYGSSGNHNVIKAFESPVDIINLCHLIDCHYSLEIVCKALINYRISGEVQPEYEKASGGE